MNFWAFSETNWIDAPVTHALYELSPVFFQIVFLWVCRTIFCTLYLQYLNRYLTKHKKKHANIKIIRVTRIYEQKKSPFPINNNNKMYEHELNHNLFRTVAYLLLRTFNKWNEQTIWKFISKYSILPKQYKLFSEIKNQLNISNVLPFQRNAKAIEFVKKIYVLFKKRENDG